MFKLSLALSAVSFVVGVDVAEYCTQFVSKCGDVHTITSVDVCLSAMNTTALGEMNGQDVDTIGCRFKYLNNSEFAGRTDSCRYAGPSGGGRCGIVLDNVCRIASGVCMGALASYPDTDACKAALAPLATQWGYKQGTAAAAAADDSLECRVYHAIASLAQPDANHCSHWSLESAQCKNAIVPDATHYCELLEFNCNTSSTMQFSDKAQCLGVAAKYGNVPTTVLPNNTANSLGCRIYHAIAAKVLNKGHCGHAGPTGGGACGTTSDAWSSLLSSTCMDTTVQSALTLLVTPANVNAAFPTGFQTENATQAAYTFDLDQAKATQACRFYHLSAAATSTASAALHCPHGNVMGGGVCGTIEGNLCQVIKYACDFANTPWQFSSMDACTMALKNSTAFPIALGDSSSTSGNNYACRFYHATVAASYLPDGQNYNASTTAERTANIQTHCGHILKTPIAMFPAGCTGSPTPKPSSASSLSALMALVVAVVSVFSM